MLEKKELLCCSTGEEYIDEDMQYWKYTCISNKSCIRCHKNLGDNGEGYYRPSHNIVYCGDCVSEIPASEMFRRYHKYQTINSLMSRFGNMMGSMQVEFLMHLEKKKDSWQDCPLYELIGTLATCFLKFNMAEQKNDIEASYDELIDIALMCLMIGTRYREEIGEHERSEQDNQE